MGGSELSRSAARYIADKVALSNAAACAISIDAAEHPEKALAYDMKANQR